MTDLPEVADRLYDEPLDRFVAARDELARSLRDSGDRAAAAAVRRLKRPSIAAWALNTAIRADASLGADLRDLATRLHEAHTAALRGDGAPLRELGVEERGTVERTTRAAGAAARVAGHAATDVLHRRIAATVRAALSDVDVLDALSGGTLATDHEAPGLGFAPGAEVPTPLPTADRRAEREAELRRRRAEAEVARLDERAVDIERAATEAAERADRLAADAAAARRLADEARRALGG